MSTDATEKAVLPTSMSVEQVDDAGRKWSTLAADTSRANKKARLSSGSEKILGELEAFQGSLNAKLFPEDLAEVKRRLSALKKVSEKLKAKYQGCHQIVGVATRDLSAFEKKHRELEATYYVSKRLLEIALSLVGEKISDLAGSAATTEFQVFKEKYRGLQVLMGDATTEVAKLKEDVCKEIAKLEEMC